MLDNVYQDYINSIIGAPQRNLMNLDNTPFSVTSNVYNMDLERYYPEIYKILYPMIQSACMRNTKPLTEETLDEMVKDIYSNFNAEDLTNDVRSSTKSKESSSTNKLPTKTDSTEVRGRGEDRVIRPNNYMLNDLIRILLIRELLGRPGPFPPNRPGFPPPRPPFRPRDLQSQEYSIFEDSLKMYPNYNEQYF